MTERLRALALRLALHLAIHWRWTRDQPGVWWTLALLLIGAQFADILTTTLNLQHSRAIEANPYAHLLMQHGGWPALNMSKVLLALALCLLLVAFSLTPAARRSWAGGLALVAAGVGVVGYWLVIGNNLGVLLIVSHTLGR